MAVLVVLVVHGGGGVSLVTSVLSLSLSGFSSHMVYHLHISFHGSRKTEVNSEEQESSPQVCSEILKRRYSHDIVMLDLAAEEHNTAEDCHICVCRELIAMFISNERQDSKIYTLIDFIHINILMSL